MKKFTKAQKDLQKQYIDAFAGYQAKSTEIFALKMPKGRGYKSGRAALKVPSFQLTQHEKKGNIMRMGELTMYSISIDHRN